MIVTGPTVISPLLRQSRLQKRPAALLQWEAIVNDPVGALAAVLAFEIVVVMQTATSFGAAVQDLALGVLVATALGLAAGWGLSRAFRNALVPEYMKVPVLFVALLAIFAASDFVLHESGLLAVTIMGLWIANAGLPSYAEMRRFKEHATILLVSGVFVLLAASMSLPTLAKLDWTAALFVAVVILIARPVPVLISLAFSNIPWRERLLVAFTGPRGVVLVAVASLFGERLVELGIEDAARIPPLAFALVAASVVLHGFTLAPMARLLGLNAASAPGVILLGGSRFTVALGKALRQLELPVIVADPNHAHLREAREEGLETFFGDILSDVAEDRLELAAYEKLVCASDNDAYNTLVATDLAPEFGRENVFQLKRVKQSSSRHALPSTLGGQGIGRGDTYFEVNARLAQGWEFRVTPLSEEFTLKDWQDANPDADLYAEYGPNRKLRLLGPGDSPNGPAGARLLALIARAAGAKGCLTGCPFDPVAQGGRRPRDAKERAMNLFSDIRALVLTAIAEMQAAGTLPGSVPVDAITVEPPRDPGHGDMATNAAMVLARPAGKKPREIAEALAARLADDPRVAGADVAGPGFLNLRLAASVWQALPAAILKAGTDYGRSGMGQGARVNIEYVSANPTGPMHVGHARGAVVGDAMASLLAYAGFDVTGNTTSTMAGRRSTCSHARSTCVTSKRTGMRWNSRTGPIPATISCRRATA